MDKLPRISKDRDLSEGITYIWINYQEWGNIETSPRERYLGHSDGVALFNKYNNKIGINRRFKCMINSRIEPAMVYID